MSNYKYLLEIAKQLIWYQSPSKIDTPEDLKPMFKRTLPIITINGFPTDCDSKIGSGDGAIKRNCRKRFFFHIDELYPNPIHFIFKKYYALAKSKKSKKILL
jgi:hypothetical protein